jgi:transposase-like protein
MATAILEEVRTFLARPIEGEHFLRVARCDLPKVRHAAPGRPVATVVAIGVNDQRQRSILGVQTGRARTISSGPRSFAR